MLSAEQFRKMETYFAGEMNAEEEAAFLAEVESDEALKQEFAFERQLRGAIIEHGTGQLFPPVDETAPGYTAAKAFVAGALNNEERGDKKKFRLFTLTPRLRAAAIIIGVLGIAALVFLLLNNRRKPGGPLKQQDMLVQDSGAKKTVDTTGAQQTPGIKIPPKQPAATELAFKEFYRPYSNHADKSVRLGKVIQALEAGNYNKAVYEADHISQLMGSNDTDSVMEGQRHFYKGLCFIELKKPDAAIKSFDKALNYRKSIPETVPDIYWYSAMAYLQKNDKQKTVRQINLLLSEQSPEKYKEMAKELKTNLD